MKKILIAVVITLAVVLVFRSCSDKRERNAALRENSMLIQQQISNVSKLVITEGHFSEVYTYEDSKELFGDLLTADKRALVVVNAEASVSFDLSKIMFEVDESNRTLHIRNIPEPEISLNPDFEYYDVRADYLNPFEAEDYNSIKNTVKASLLRKVKASSLITNAENRLISELQKFYILTNSMGWTLTYDGVPVEAGDPGIFRVD